MINRPENASMKYYFLILLSLAVLGSGCKNFEQKYVEGPIVSPYTAADRVTNTWLWSYHWVEGENLSGVYADSTLELSDDNIVKICGPEEGCREGSWRLISKKTRLQFIFGQEAVAYDIDMLRKDEMWLSVKNADSVNTVVWQLVSKGE